MDRIRIVGGNSLSGVIPISGAKNAALPLMIASLLTDDTLTLELRAPGQFALVPKGTWHTAKVHETSRAVFITAGEGTEHRPA